MKKNLKEICRKFTGKLIGTSIMKLYVCETISFMPDDITEFVTQNCWFLSSMENAWAFTFTGNDLADKHLIFLSDDLLLQRVEQIRFIIAHEVGHVVLGHRNSVMVRQSKKEIQKQEKEADTFAQTYLIME